MNPLNNSAPKDDYSFYNNVKDWVIENPKYTTAIVATVVIVGLYLSPVTTASVTGAISNLFGDDNNNIPSNDKGKGPDNGGGKTYDEALNELARARKANGYVAHMKIEDGVIYRWSDSAGKYLEKTEYEALKVKLNESLDLSTNLVNNEEISLNDYRTGKLMDIKNDTLDNIKAISDPEDRAEALKIYEAASKKNTASDGWVFSKFLKRWFTNSEYDSLDQPQRINDSNYFTGDYSDYFAKDLDNAINSARDGVHTSTPKDGSSSLPTHDKSSISIDTIFDAEATPKPSSSKLADEETALDAGGNLSDEEQQDINPKVDWDSKKI